MGKKDNSIAVNKTGKNDEALAHKEPESAGDNPEYNLTDGEERHLSLMSKGRTIKEIAEKMCVTKKTVETYRQRLKEKLNLENMAQLHKFAYDYTAKRNNRYS